MVKDILYIMARIEHKTYCEVFGGGGVILMNKAPIGVEVYNDIDGGLYDFFTVMSTPELFEQFRRIVSAIPRSRQIFNESKHVWHGESDLVKRVAMWFVVVRQSWGGVVGSKSGWSYSVGAATGKTCISTSNWMSAISKLPGVHKRLLHVQIERDDFRRLIPRYDSKETLFYCDPPYVWSTRTKKGSGSKRSAYRYEMNNRDHAELIQLLLQAKGSFIVSG